VILGLIVGVMSWLNFAISNAVSNLLMTMGSTYHHMRTDELRGGMIIGMVGATFGGLFFSLVSTGLTGMDKANKAIPNQGINLSLRNSSAVFLVTWLIFGLLLGLSFLPALGLRDLLSSLDYGLDYGLIVGLIAGLNRGGSAVIKHYALRLMLWLSGYTPFKFIKFLDQCAKLILLKKVGGGYIFIHRMLLEYFADIPTQHPSVKRDSSIS
jgi:hypothetical protein